MNLTFNDQFILIDGSDTEKGYYTLPGVPPALQGNNILLGFVLNPIGIVFYDSYNITDGFSNQPTEVLNDHISFSDAFGLFLSEGILLLLSDVLSFGDSLFVVCYTSLLFNDSYNALDTFFIGRTNNPTFGDFYIPTDSIAGQMGCFITLNDSVSFSDALNLAEGFVSETIILSDSFTVQDLLQLMIPNVTLNIILSDDTSPNWMDSLTTSDIEMLNTYLRRYLNDVISN